MEEITIKDSLKITPMQVGGDGKTVQLILTGYLDTYNAPEFQNHINSLIEKSITKIIFNCNGLDYISSTGIGAFTAFLKNLRQKKGDMVFFGLQNKVLEVFQLLGFTKFFKIATDLDRALQLLNEEYAAGTPMALFSGGRKRNTAKTKASGRGRVTPKKPTAKKSIFPYVFNCPHCGKKLKAPEAGKYRCSGCKGVLRVEKQGKVYAE